MDVIGEDYYLKEKLGKENVVLEDELEKDQEPRLKFETMPVSRMLIAEIMIVTHVPAVSYLDLP